MANTEKAIEAVKFVCDNLGKEVYIVSRIFCDECPDIGKEQCPLRTSAYHDSLEKVHGCQKKRVIVRSVHMDVVDVHMGTCKDDVMIVIAGCYVYAPEHIFTTREAATAHMESLPADIMKFYECGN